MRVMLLLLLLQMFSLCAMKRTNSQDFAFIGDMSMPPEKKIKMSDVVQFFLDQGADTNTVLICSQLVDKDIDYEKIKKAGKKNLLAFACKKLEENDIKQLLLDERFNLQKKEDQNLLIRCACQKGWLSVIKVLFGNCQLDVNQHDVKYKTVLHRACSNNSIEILEYILQTFPADKEKQDYHRYTPLHMAVYHLNADCVNLLLQYGARRDLSSDAGLTPLHIACNEGVCEPFSESAEEEIIQKLLECGASTTVQCYDNKTPLLYAFYADMIHSFADKDRQAFVHSVDEQGNSQLHLAAKVRLQLDQYRKYRAYLLFLVSQGLDVWHRNKSGKLPVDIAMEDYHNLYRQCMINHEFYLVTSIMNQEYIMHGFLQLVSPRISYAFFCTLLEPLLPEIRSLIARWYYEVNSETIVAKKYKDNEDYYEHSLFFKDIIKDDIRNNPTRETIRLLWS